MTEKRVTFFAGGSGHWSEALPIDNNLSIIVQQTKLTGVLSMDDNDMVLMCFMTGYDKLREDGLVVDAKGHAEFIDVDGDKVWLSVDSYWGEDEYRIDFKLASGTGKWEQATGDIGGVLTLVAGGDDEEKYGVIEAEGLINFHTH